MLCYVGLIILLIDTVYMLLPSKLPNWGYKYRKTLSRKSTGKWRAVQWYSGCSFVVLGYIYLVMGLSIHKILPRVNTMYEGIIAISGIIVMIIIDEIHFKHKFSKNTNI